MKTFSDQTQASAYCVIRKGDYAQLFEDMKARETLSLPVFTAGERYQCVDMGYCRIHVQNRKMPDGHKTNECWIANRRGETMAAGRNVTKGQVAEFILRKFW